MIVNEISLFHLPDGRSVKKDGKSGVISISPIKSIKKENYNIYTEQYSDKVSFFVKFRIKFQDLQANNFKKNPTITSRLISHFLTYVPRVDSENGSFLDIGCNTGVFLTKLPDTWKKFGVEINKRAFNEANKYKNISVFNSSIEDFNPRIKFNYIRASHVIEHLDDSDLFFRKIKQITKPKANLLIYTPNADSISLNILKKYWAGFSDQTHVKIYNLSNLSEIAKTKGFIVKESGTYPMGITAGSLVNYLKKFGINNFSIVLFTILFILIYPLTLVADKFKKGSALYLLLEKK